MIGTRCINMLKLITQLKKKISDTVGFARILFISATREGINCTETPNIGIH